MLLPSPSTQASLSVIFPERHKIEKVQLDRVPACLEKRVGWGTWLCPASPRPLSVPVYFVPQESHSKKLARLPRPLMCCVKPRLPKWHRIEDSNGSERVSFLFLKYKHTNTSSQVTKLKTGMGICQLVCYCRNGNWNWVSWQLFWICCSNGHWHWHWTAFLHFCPSIRMLSPLSSHALVSGGRCLV